LQDLNAPLHRSGGNAETRYNWQLNATSHAADWYFESIADANTVGGDGDDFIQESKNGGAQAMLTIPIIGWWQNSDRIAPAWQVIPPTNTARKRAVIHGGRRRATASQPTDSTSPPMIQPMRT